MLYAWVNGVKRPPITKGERTTCRDCGGMLTSVMPVENVKHWRHKAGDCDAWSEPEGPWHLAWKEAFSEDCREIGLIDPTTGERHRADVLCGTGTPHATVLELQYSPISEDERTAREAFYRQKHRMFWLVHVHDSPSSFMGWNFAASLDWKSRPVDIDGRRFSVMRWFGRSSQFIEKWKRATAHVFFECQGRIFFLAGDALARRITGGFPLQKGQYALCHLTREEFIHAVQGGNDGRR
ncbi:TPA: hypothetical protein VDU60_004014 [Pseudomonas aeruginosa]|uniref:hypothetical protein n=1 Tax=Pseudomonas TaxID=286 RepID=UPI000F7E726E|nr:hypothetical protein [Pseudomonas aeruginosa]HEK0639839.1 hypothetical protein [Proteus mirabilis]MCO2884352.1 hypothetical protein [Pseudomonas aeruginosa]RTB43988.1 hypothetical protein EJ655_07535 [Pseudomonas aeruginosa]RTB47949.1 hypothetical protein EJ640_23580 [Pseudomonas aeruginosa]RTB82300.1 hypothetical protein EJ641_18170 [Pseudomonas aeruginosa]